MAKKLVIVTLVLLVLSCLVSVFYNEMRPVVGVGTANVSYGDECYVPVYIGNVYEKIDAFDIAVEFNNADLELLRVDKGNIVDCLGEEISMPCSSELYANREGKFVVVYVDPTAGEHEIEVGSGRYDVVYLTFRPKKPKADGLVKLADVNIVKTDGTTIDKNTYKLIDGGVRVE